MNEAIEQKGKINVENKRKMWGEGKKNPFFIASLTGLCVHAKSRNAIAKKSWLLLLLSSARHWTTKKRGKVPYITESIISYQNFSRYFFSSFLSSFLLIAALKCISSSWGWGYERISNDVFISDVSIKFLYQNFPSPTFKAILSSIVALFWCVGKFAHALFYERN